MLIQELSNVTDQSIDYLEKGKNMLIDYGPKVLSAIGLLVIGMFIIKKILGVVKRKSEGGRLDKTIAKFLLSLLRYALTIFLIMTCLGLLGFESTALAGVLAGLALGVGLALQGSLSNVAGGLLIMVLKPYKLGDLIEGQGEIGNVKEIDIFTTKIITPQNKLVVIPNGAMSNGNITNYTTQGVLKVFHTIGVSYDADIKQTKNVLMKVLTDQEKVLDSPTPLVEVAALNDSSVDFAVRPACRTEDYWDVYFTTLEKAKIALDAAGIEIPYPHSVEIQKDGN
ncbi:mechanosensitive ion channel protein [Patiriisocius marinistellae]|uniref:Mechanosensitive ion channel protein n=1 Tax=Patiriisocius marinistellae TaxID=2494560 RepID=A0A5J4G1H2_9FLAO|nr:mechanosensitive ion channel domain-containing protein [Patiriisocius marinistellae]GEQ86386.1 mechanosensitive ion channel protein [Patiriisocius marinistellae]